MGVHGWYVPESSKGKGTTMLFLHLENLEIRFAESDSFILLSVKRCQAPFAEVVEFVVELVYERPLFVDRGKHEIVAKPCS
jgi:hypothetical protein